MIDLPTQCRSFKMEIDIVRNVKHFLKYKCYRTNQYVFSTYYLTHIIVYFPIALNELFTFLFIFMTVALKLFGTDRIGLYFLISHLESILTTLSYLSWFIIFVHF